MIAAPAATTILPDLDGDVRWLAVRTIIDSPLFSRSPRLCSLLLYLAEQTLQQRPDLLTEATIASRVFDRDEGFDPGLDTIVRSHMVRLRQKLEQYAEENRDQLALRVIVPRGEYAVRFEPVPFTQPERPALLETLPAPIPAQNTTHVERSNHPLLWAVILLSLAVVILGVRLWTISAPAHPAPASRSAVHPLWSHLFSPRQTTTFVAADSGLVMLHKFTGHPTTLAEYLSRDFSRETQGLSRPRSDDALDLAERRYTSFVDMNMFERVEHLPWASSGQLELRYARDLHMDDLKQGNFIFSGSRGANPWLELYEPAMNFVGVNDDVRHTFTFINRNPRPGEAPAFVVTAEDPQRRVLGVLAFLANLDGAGNVLIVEGNSMAGTEAISDFLFDDHALLPFLAKITRPDGSLPHFEVLIESTSINGSAGPFHVIAYRTAP